MADESDPRRIDKLLKRTPTERLLQPVQPVEPVRARRDVVKTYRRVFRPSTPPQPTDAAHITVREVMSHPPITIRSDATLDEAQHLLDARDIRHLVVVDDGFLVGLLTRRQLALPALAGNVAWAAERVRDHMLTGPPTIAAQHTLLEAAQRLTHHGTSGLPVIRPPGEVVGFVTARDLLQVLVREAPVTLWV